MKASVGLRLATVLVLGLLSAGCLDSTAPGVPGNTPTNEDPKTPDDRALAQPAGLDFA